jgi:GNAT superfamily N-acetyltransferase
MHIRPVTPEDWQHIETLFGPRGACGGCWCMSWRVPHHGKAWEAVKGEKNRASLQALTVAGNLHAVLAFDGEQPVGWCSFGPRATFPRLETVRALAHEWDAGTWSVVCFFIDRHWRKRGVGVALLEAATARAFELGAERVEGYPAVPAKGELPAAFAWTGVPKLFEAAGYEKAPHQASRPTYIKRRL